MVEVGRRAGVSSVHVNFLPKEDWDYLGEFGFLSASASNITGTMTVTAASTTSLNALNSRKRKTIRKERRQLEEWGLTFEALTGDDLQEHHWDTFFRFYRNTVDRKWGGAYLTRDFFFRLHETMADRTVLDRRPARRPDRLRRPQHARRPRTLRPQLGLRHAVPIPAFRGLLLPGHRLCDREGLARVEAGAQGQHKIQRGYVPVETYSAHWIADRNFRRAVADYLERERDAVGEEIEFLADFTPFRKEG